MVARSSAWPTLVGGCCRAQLSRRCWGAVVPEHPDEQVA